MEGLFEKGVEEFNSGFFFEAHDTWEELWMETTGSHRLFYQGLIQTAVGFYHLGNENYKGACSQLTKALAKLESYLPQYHGIATEELKAQVRICLAEAQQLKDGSSGPFDESIIPKIRWCRQD